MKTVILSEFVFRTEYKGTFLHGIHKDLALQYYGGDTGLLVTFYSCDCLRHCERVKVDTETDQYFSSFRANPHYKKLHPRIFQKLTENDNI